jgi:hypothetical protein
MGYRDHGTIDWHVLDYDECEKKGYFSGLRIGKKNIYLVSPYKGSVKFAVSDMKGSITKEMSKEEFVTLLKTVFEEDEIEYINKCIWRTSS